MNERDTTIQNGPAPTLPRCYLALLVPLILTHALQSAGGLLDGFWLGRLLGVRGLATAASFFPVFFLLLSLIIGLGAGATVLTGQAWGAHDAAQVRRVGATAVVAALGVGLAVAVGGAWSAPWLMQALGTPPDILPAAICYARAMFAVMPFVFVAWMCLSLSRGTGDAVSPMWSLLVATLVGAVCTPLLVAGTPLGATGVAASTVVTQLSLGTCSRHPCCACSWNPGPRWIKRSPSCAP